MSGLSLSSGSTSDAVSLLENGESGASPAMAVAVGGIKAVGDSEEEIERLLAAAQEASIQIQQRYVRRNLPCIFFGCFSSHALRKTLAPQVFHETSCVKNFSHNQTFPPSIFDRTVLESAVLYSKEWLQRAENLQLMTMDEQKLFLKVLENCLFFNCRFFLSERYPYFISGG